MWISVRYHTNSAPNQWIAEWGVQNAQCSHLLPPSDAQCPLNHTRSLPSLIKSRLLRSQVVTMGPHHGPPRMAHHALLLISSYSALGSVQCPVPLLLTTHEWPLWLALSLPVWPCTLQLAALSNCILSVCYCPVTSYWYCESVNRD